MKISGMAKKWIFLFNIIESFEVSFTKYAIWQRRPSVCPSVRLSLCHTLRFYQNDASQNHENFTVSSAKDSNSFRMRKAFPEIRKGSPRSRALNKKGVGKIGDFQPISRRISETVHDKAKITINH